MKCLRWIGDNFPGLLAFGLAVWALVVGDQEMARFFLLLVVLFGISRQVADLRERIETDRGPARSPNCGPAGVRS